MQIQNPLDLRLAICCTNTNLHRSQTVADSKVDHGSKTRKNMRSQTIVDYMYT
jgi:hypothetical protein